MAASITHVVLAERLRLKYWPEMDRSLYLVGTLFPDIRLLGSMPRERTHVKGVTLDAIAEAPTPFFSGMLVHSLVDVVRHDYMQEHLYRVTRPMWAAEKPGKFLEDELRRGEIADWETIAGYFGEPSPEELTYEAPAEEIRRWHALQADYIREAPTAQTRHKLIWSIYPTRGAELMQRGIDWLHQDSEAREVLERFSRDFMELAER